MRISTFRVDRALTLARQRARWLRLPPLVSHDRPRMFPGALSIGEDEEREVVEAVREVMRGKRLSRFVSVSGNPFARSRVDRLERSFAARMGTDHTLAVNSGTSALVCALAGLGIGPGDEVIVPAYTWFSTATAVLAVGAVPIVAEVDASLTLDPEDAERRVSPLTKAIIAVHMRGAPADMSRLMRLAGARGLRLIEDVAQAPGASYRSRPLGSLGDAGTFSFEMSKVITAGEGGMVITGDAHTHRRAAMYHDSAAGPHLGLSTQEWLPGVNLRMSELHAAVLLVQLRRLDHLLQRMRETKQKLERIVEGELRRCGASFRTLHDRQGEAALALIFFLPDPDSVPGLVRGLGDDNVPAGRLYHELAHLPHDIVDLHAYPAWAPLIAQRAWSDSGQPWRGHPREVTYRIDDFPATVDLLRRAVQIDISPYLRPQHVEQMGTAIVRAIRRAG